MSLRAPEARPEEVAQNGASRLAAVLAAGMARLSLTPTGGKKKEGGRTNKDGSGPRAGGGTGGPRQAPEDRRKSKALKEDADRYLQRLSRGLTPYEQAQYAEVRELAKRSAASQQQRRQKAADAKERNELEERFATHEELDAWLEQLREADDATMDAILEGMDHALLPQPPPELSAREQAQRLPPAWKRVRDILYKMHKSKKKNPAEAKKAAASLRAAVKETEDAVQRAKEQGDSEPEDEWEKFKEYMANWDDLRPPAAPRAEAPRRVVLAKPLAPEKDDDDELPEDLLVPDQQYKDYMQGRRWRR